MAVRSKGETGFQHKHSPNVVLTMVDLKVVDSQSFKDGHAWLVNVKRLTQLRVCYTVYSASLEAQTISETFRDADRDMQRHRQTDPYLYVVISEESL